MQPVLQGAQGWRSRAAGLEARQQATGVQRRARGHRRQHPLERPRLQTSVWGAAV
jgi:hypothetical protein